MIKTKLDAKTKLAELFESCYGKDRKLWNFRVKTSFDYCSNAIIDVLNGWTSNNKLSKIFEEVSFVFGEAIVVNIKALEDRFENTKIVDIHTACFELASLYVVNYGVKPDDPKLFIEHAKYNNFLCESKFKKKIVDCGRLSKFVKINIHNSSVNYNKNEWNRFHQKLLSLEAKRDKKENDMPMYNQIGEWDTLFSLYYSDCSESDELMQFHYQGRELLLESGIPDPSKHYKLLSEFIEDRNWFNQKSEGAKWNAFHDQVLTLEKALAYRSEVKNNENVGEKDRVLELKIIKNEIKVPKRNINPINGNLHRIWSTLR